MTLSDKQIQILRDCQRFSAIRTYHGLLPEKISSLYDEDVVRELIALSLLERGTVVSRCGGKLNGLRLTPKAEALLPGMPSVELSSIRELPDEELDAEDFSILRDVFHYSHIKCFGGMSPKDGLEDLYGKKVVRRLFDLGLLLSIKLKGREADKKRSRKGYILSDLGRRVLARADVLHGADSSDPEQ